MPVPGASGFSGPVSWYGHALDRGKDGALVVVSVSGIPTKIE